MIKKKVLFWIIFLVVVICLIYLTCIKYCRPYAILEKSSSNTNSNNKASGNVQVLTSGKDLFVSPDFNHLKDILSKEKLISDFPTSGSLKLSFYHFFQGQRIWDKTFFITKGKIEDKDAQADINIWIASIYVDKFDGTNLCSIIQEARKNGDFGQEFDLGKAKLLWKYAGMIKYKNCFGF